MGTWNTKINGSDSFQDIYQQFFELYNQGQEPVDVSKQVRDDFAEMFSDTDDRYPALFALALCQWETKSLEPEVLIEAKDIIEGGKDIVAWQEQGVDEKTLTKRRLELEKFLLKISTEKEKAKRRVRTKFKYSAIELLNILAPDGQRRFQIIESYDNDVYLSTSAMINLPWMGSGVFSFYEQGKSVTAQWIDDMNLEIRHDKTIVFAQKIEALYFSGYEGTIKYIPI